MMKSFINTTLAVTAAVLLLTACETVEGFGRDTNKLGNNISGAADEATPRPSSTGN